MSLLHEDIRWKQRFENFKKSFQSMQEILEIHTLSKTERAALIKYFEMTFELSWKLIKDYLEEIGYTPKSPRDAIKQGLQADLIEDGHQWLDALQKRNITTHTYDEETSKIVETLIRTHFFPLLNKLNKKFTSLT